jgi:7-carboxy-7-deazaguanine synthase
MGNSFLKWNLKYLNPHDELKFVITNYIDYLFAKNFIEANQPQVAHIHFAPVTSVLEPSLLAAWMLEDKLKARLSLQLHRLLAIP